MKKLRFFALILAMIMVIGLAACSSDSSSDSSDDASSESTDDEVVIGASFSQTNITPFGSHLYQDLVDLCEEKGWTLISMDAERDATKEASNVESLILQDIDILFYWPYDKEAAVVNAQAAYEAGIPVVTVNADVADEGQEYTVAYVGPDQLSMSTAIGEWVVEQTGGTGNIVVIDGTAGTTQYLLRMEGFESVIDEYDGLQIIAHEYVAGDRDEAITFMENCITTYGDEIDVVYCPGSDNVAIGAVQALQDAGMTDVIVCSIDGMQEAFDLIETGELTMTVLQKPLYIIEKFMEVAETILDGGEFDEREQYSEFTIVTIDNLDEVEAEY